MIGQQIEKYRIEKLLGKGGLGSVYQAEDVTLKRPVALKVIYPHFVNQPAYREHVLREARSAARLTHPSIATIFNFDQEESLLYLVMEFVVGQSLAGLLAKLRKQKHILQLDEALYLTAQVADALSYAHQQGVLHRNLKPSNIMVKPADDMQRSAEQIARAVVSDFGMTRLLRGDVKSASVALSDALPYMSPEQCIGNEVDGRSDIYALSVILYQLTTGTLPFDITSPTEAMVMHALETPPSPRIRQPGIPKSVEAIIKKGLAKKPKHRYQDAEQMADELRQAAAALPLSTHQAYLPGTFTSLRVLNPPAHKDSDSNNNRHNRARPIDGWLPLPENELISLLQAELDSSITFEPISIHDEPPVEALPEAQTAAAVKPVVTDTQQTPMIPLTTRSQPQPRPAQLSTQPAQSDKIIISRPGRAPRAVMLDKDILQIGRSRDNEIVLETRDVSRYHAQLERTPDGWRVTDLNSSGGTYWGDHRLVPHVPETWRQNQSLRIGPFSLRWQPARSPYPFRPDAGHEDEPLTELHYVPDGGTQTSSRTGQFSFMVTPTILTLGPGQQSRMQVELFNQGVSGDLFSLRVVDLSPELVALSQNTVHLAPGTRTQLPLTISVPKEGRLQAGNHPFQIIVRSESDPSETAVISARLITLPTEKFSVGVWPLEIKENGTCQVLIRNEGNVPSRLSMVGQSDDASLRFHGERGSVKLSPGEATTLSLDVASDKRPFWGRSRRYPFTVRVRSTSGEQQNQQGHLVMPPIVPAWALPVLEIFLVVLLAALTIPRFFGGSNTQAEVTTPATSVQDAGDTAVLSSPPPESDEQSSLSDVATAVPTLTSAVGAVTDDDDGDGLTNEEEANRRTDPSNPDTDGDGLPDGDEVYTYGTNPSFRDTDLDGMSDSEELSNGTDPLRFPVQQATAVPTQPPPSANPSPAATTPPQPTTAPGNTAVPTAAATNPAPTAVPPTAVPPTNVPPGDNTVQLALLDSGSGWLSETGTVSTGIASAIQAGDLISNESVRGFLSYDLSTLPATATINSARLSFPLTAPDSSIEGDPFTDLDCLLMEAVEFELPLDAADFDAFAFYIDCEVGQPTAVDVLLDVQDAVDFDLPMIQFRIGFEINTDGDGANDLYVLRAAPTLEVNYTP